MVDLYYSMGGGTGGGHVICLFFISDYSVIAVVSVSLLFNIFLSLVPLTRSYWCIGILVSFI